MARLLQKCAAKYRFVAETGFKRDSLQAHVVAHQQSLGLLDAALQDVVHRSDAERRAESLCQITLAHRGVARDIFRRDAGATVLFDVALRGQYARVVVLMCPAGGDIRRLPRRVGIPREFEWRLFAVKGLYQVGAGADGWRDAQCGRARSIAPDLPSALPCWQALRIQIVAHHVAHCRSTKMLSSASRCCWQHVRA